MRLSLFGLFLSAALWGCGPGAVSSTAPEPMSQSAAEALKFPGGLVAEDFHDSIEKASIRARQRWLDDAAFELKWSAMLKAPIEFLGGANSTFHGDLKSAESSRMPGFETLCHGDPKLDNFGWLLVEGVGIFSDSDFDDAGFCPVAADALRYLVATNLWFNDPSLDTAALNAYVQTLRSDSNGVTVDGASEPSWADLHDKGLAKSTRGDSLVLGGEVQAATGNEVASVRALARGDSRFPTTVLDVARNVRVSGGSAGLRRFGVLTQTGAGVRTILELKELGAPGTESGLHSRTLDGPERFETLKHLWWHSAGEGDHFEVQLFGARFLVRDRLTRSNPKPDKLTPSQLTNMVQAEASLLARAHRGAWGRAKAEKIASWLAVSSVTVSQRWRAAYAAAGGQ